MLIYIEALCDTCELAIKTSCSPGWGCEAYGRQFCFICGPSPEIGTCDAVCCKLPPKGDDCRNYRQREDAK